VLFIVGCNKQVFSPKPWKRFGSERNAHLNSRKWSHRTEG